MPSFHLEISDCASSLFCYLLSSLSWYGVCFKIFFQESSYQEHPNDFNLSMLLLLKDYSGCPNMNQNNMNKIIISIVCLKEQNFFLKLSNVVHQRLCMLRLFLLRQIIVVGRAQFLHLAQIMHLSNKQRGCAPLESFSQQCISYFLKKINATFSIVLL